MVPPTTIRRGAAEGGLVRLAMRMLLLMSFSITAPPPHAQAYSNPCDESKCRATRPHPWVDGETEHTCWIPVANATTLLQDPEALCSDGFVAHLVPEFEPVYRDELEALSTWITCCPPDYTMTAEDENLLANSQEETIVIAQTCSDDACSSPDWEGGGNCWADGFQEPMICSSQHFQYPRATGLMSLIYVQYICCTEPSEQEVFHELLWARAVWISLSAITFVTCTVFILGVLSSRHTRRQGYNLYLIFLAFPDALANLFLVIRNAITISGVAGVSPQVHIVLASIEYFYASANMWLNAVIVYQIHLVLRSSKHCIRIPPPTVKKVCKQASIIYAFSCVGFAWAFLLYYRGLIYFSLDAVVLIWILTRVIMVAPPLFYVCFVYFDVWYRQLLPKSGRTRVLSLYFLRVIIVFLLTWVPYFVLYEIAWNVTHSRWMVIVSYYLGSIQGTLSVIVALSKPDIKRSMNRFLQCKFDRFHRGEHHSDEEGHHYSGWTTSQDRSRSQFGRATTNDPSSAEHRVEDEKHCDHSTADESQEHLKDITEERQGDIEQDSSVPRQPTSEWYQDDVWHHDHAPTQEMSVDSATRHSAELSATHNTSYFQDESASKRVPGT